MRYCYIFGAAPMGYDVNLDIKDDDMIIAADGGLKHIERLNIKCDVVIGDFDSYGSVPGMDNVIRLNPIKDDTDTMMCIRLGLTKGYSHFIIYGGTGGRLEHTLANIQALAFIRNNGGHGFLMGEREITTVIKNEAVSFTGEASGYVSLFSLDNSIVANERQLKYTLKDATVTNDFPIGVSNEFIGEEGYIDVKGTAAVVYDVNNGICAVRFIEE